MKNPKFKDCQECSGPIPESRKTKFCCGPCRCKYHRRNELKKQKISFLTLIVIKKRKCLRCNKLFNSQGVWNRICFICKNKDDYANGIINYVFDPQARRR